MALECDGGKPGKTDEVLSGFAPLSERKNKNVKNSLCLQGQVILSLLCLFNPGASWSLLLCP